MPAAAPAAAGRTAATFEPRQSRVEIDVLFLVARLGLIDLVAQLLDLPLQGLHLCLQRIDLVDQIDVALRAVLAGLILFEFGYAFCQAHALGLRGNAKCNGSQHGRRANEPDWIGQNLI